jgi:hypothetical protein
LKTAWANSSQDPILKTPITKNWSGGVAQGEGPEFKFQYHKKKNRKKEILKAEKNDMGNLPKGHAENGKYI